MDGLSGILSATVNGSQIIVTAEANNSENTINQTLLISLTNGNTFTVPVKVAPVGDSDGYTLISTLEALSAGRYLMAGYAEKNNDNVDLTPYTYQMWTGAISSNDAEAKSNSDLITSAYQYANNQLTPQNASELATTEVELIAVSGKANTYYIKVGYTIPSMQLTEDYTSKKQQMKPNGSLQTRVTEQALLHQIMRPI